MVKEIVLMSDVPGLGLEGDLVKVADGYARNYLLPRKLAVPIKALGRRQLDARQAERENRMRSDREKAERLVETLKDMSVTIPVKAGAEGKLYGSVNAADISEALGGMGIQIDRHKISLKEPLRTLGVFDVALKLHPDFQAQIKVWVVEE